jgi:hypothetical protein
MRKMSDVPENLARMHSQIQRRTGAVLLAAGTIDGAITIARLAVSGPYPAAFDGVAILAGIFLLWGGPRAALWVRTLAVFLLAAGIVLGIAAPLFQPLDLTFTEIRLAPADFAAKALAALALLCVTLLVALRLGHPSVRDAILSARITRWDMRIPAQAGGGLVALAGLLLWLALHGQSADLATSLALQQLGPDYRYHLSWISSGDNGHGRTVTGIVTAWNATQVKKVLLHWETR